MHVDSKARPSGNVAEPGRGKRVPPGTPGTPQNPDAASASLPERPDRRRTRTRQARPSRNARNVAEPGRDKRVPPGSPQCSKESPFSGGTSLSRPQSPTRHLDGHGSLRRLLHMPHGMAHSPARPRGNKGRGLRRAPCLAFSGITRDAVAYLVSAAFMNLAVSAVTVMTALPSANARFEAL